MSDRWPTRWERFVQKHFGVEPPHDCRVWLPSAAKVPLGTLKVCPKCLETRRAEEYDVDDIYGGSTWYCTWGRVRDR